MDILSILGLGAIGLGFLLAFLAYRLLATERTNNRPVYVYQVFCLALVLIGAWLQYSSNTSSQTVLDLQSKTQGLQEELVAYKFRLPELQDELNTAKLDVAAGKQMAEQLGEKLARSIAVMEKIASMVPESIQNLQAVNAILTGNSCSGGRGGEPIWGGNGTEMAKLSTIVISNLASAKSSIESVLP